MPEARFKYMASIYLLELFNRISYETAVFLAILLVDLKYARYRGIGF